MCVLCGEDACKNPTRAAKASLVLKGGLELATGVLGLSAQGPDSKVYPLGKAATDSLFDVLQNAGWVPPTPRTPGSSAHAAIAFSQVDGGPFWNAACLGPPGTNPASVAVMTDGHKLWLTVNGSMVGAPKSITPHFMASQGWTKATRHHASALVDQKGAVLGLALGGALVVLALITLLTVFLFKKCKTF